MNDKSLREIQAEVGRWAKGQFGENPSKDDTSILFGAGLGSLPALLGMVEELGELCHAVVYRHQGRGYADSAEYRAAKEDALADVLIFMCDYAGREGIDLTAALNRTWGKVRQRRAASWGEDKGCEAPDLRTAEEVQRGVPPPAPMAERVQDVLRDELRKTGSPAPRPRAEVLKQRNAIHGCCDRYANRMACDCLAEAEAYDRRGGAVRVGQGLDYAPAEPTPPPCPQPSGPYPPGSPYRIEGRACEVCERPATNANHDTTLDGSYEEHHYYCREHARPTRWLREVAKGLPGPGNKAGGRSNWSNDEQSKL